MLAELDEWLGFIIVVFVVLTIQVLAYRHDRRRWRELDVMRADANKLRD